MSDAAPNRDTSTYTRIKNPRWLLLARAAWIAAALLTLAILSAAIPRQFNVRVEFAAETFAEGLSQLGLTAQFYGGFFIFFEHGIAVFCLLTAAFIFWRRSDDWMAILYSLALMTFIPMLGPSGAELGVAQAEWRPLVFVGQVASSISIVSAYYLFPDGRFVPRWTRYAILIFPLWEVVRVYSRLWSAGIFPETPVPSLFFTIGIWFGSDVYAQIYRYRKTSNLTQKQQTRWIVFGFAVVIAGQLMYVLAQNLLLPQVVNQNVGHLLYRMIVYPLFLYIPLLLIPLSMAFSILRYRLYDIDFIIHRGLVYGSLTLLLALIYFGCVAVVQALFQQSSVALAVSSLVIAFLFQPLRMRLQAFIDRRFYRGYITATRLAETTPSFSGPSGQYSGTQFGSYKVLEPVGRGGMAEVYRGRHTTLNREVAIKILSADRAIEAEFRARFEREAQTVASLRHPNIVQVYDFDKAGDIYYMAMEFLEGETLSDYLRGHERISVEEARPLIQDIAAALDYAHGQGLVHRDVKPSNVMLRKAKPTPTPPKPSANLTPIPEQAGAVEAVLMDFGIAKIQTAMEGITKTGAVGTLDYMSPEQIISAKQVDHRADIYALGVLTFQLLTGRVPFRGENIGEVLFMHLQQTPPDPREFEPGLPAHVAHAIVRALAKTPEDRFQSAGEFALALN